MYFMRTFTVFCLLVLLSFRAYGFNVGSNFWQEGEADFNVNFPDRHSSGSPLPSGSADLATLQTEFVRSLNEWTNESTFNFIVDTSAPAVDPCGPSGNGTQFAPDDCGNAFGASTLAVQTEFFFGSTRVRTRINFDSNRVWNVFAGSQSGQVDFRRVALHELGHSVGLDHEDDGRPTIMTTATTNIRSLQADDLAGAAFLYDLDSDGVGFADDNCNNIANADQSNTDGDVDGDACDSDIDGDGVFNSPTIDQNFAFSAESLSNSGFSFGTQGTNGSLAQTFTVGVAGNIEAVLLPISCDTSDLQIDLRGTNSNGSPAANNIVSTTLPGGSTSATFTEIDFNSVDSLDPAVQIGDELAIVTFSSGDCFWPLATPSSGSYPGGQGYFSQDLVNFFVSTSDRPFAVRVRPSVIDNCPSDANADQADSDGDGIGDVCDVVFSDQDLDTVGDADDNCPAIPNTNQADLDEDGQGDVCDDDDDGDTVPDLTDNCALIANTDQTNSDDDSLGDVCDDDDDNDSILDAVDNCPVTASNNQSDLDEDGQGDICDADDDGDTVLDTTDNCPVNANSGQEDADSDGIGDVCDPVLNDQDSDGVGDAVDNCIAESNPNQENSDDDSFGDACDEDDDNDTVLDEDDNCPVDANLMQEDSDENGIGDACEVDDGVCFPVRTDSGTVSILCL